MTKYLAAELCEMLQPGATSFGERFYSVQLQLYPDESGISVKCGRDTKQIYSREDIEIFDSLERGSMIGRLIKFCTENDYTKNSKFLTDKNEIERH